MKKIKENTTKPVQSSGAMNKSIERYRLLVEQMNEGVLFSDETGILEFVNYSFLRMTGYKAEEIVGKNGYDIFIDDVERSRLKKLIILRKMGETGSYETQMIHRSGKKIDVRINSSPIFDNEEFVGIMSVISDISKQKRHEKFLEEIQNSLSVATGIKYFSELTSFLGKSFNVKYAMIASYRKSDESVETISVRINGEEVQNTRYSLDKTPCEQVIGKGTCFFRDNVQQLFPGDPDLTVLSARSYIGIPLFAENAIPIGLIVLIDDKPVEEIGEKEIILSLLAQRSANELSRMLAGNALAESEKKYRGIIESINDVYYQTDSAGIVTMVSPSVQLMFGYSPEELIGTKTSFYYVDPDERRGMMELLEQEGKVSDFETTIIGKTGNQVLISANIGLVYDAWGNQTGIQGIVRDITDKKLDQLERERLIMELSAKCNELMQFNYIVSHNLRAPIANLMGLANLLQMEISDEEKKTVFGYVLKATKEMDVLVRDLNAILSAKTSSGEKAEVFSISETIDSVKNNLQREITDSGAEIVARLDIPEFSGLKSYLLSVLYNLTSNAIKYRSPERKPVITISTFKKDGCFMLEVKDNGAGIDLEKHGKHVFGLYKRFNNLVEGKGLGLYMTKTQVEMMGGTIEVNSTPGEGTVFTITLRNQ